jgi:aspartate/tyrosine/aromatic aminotransferase
MFSCTDLNDNHISRLKEHHVYVPWRGWISFAGCKSLCHNAAQVFLRRIEIDN